MMYIMLNPPSAAQRQVCAQRASYGLADSYPAARLHCTMLRLGDEAHWSVAELDLLKSLLGGVSAVPFTGMCDLIAGNLLRTAIGSPPASAFHHLLRRRAE